MRADDDDSIVSIVWTQLEPEVASLSDSASIFTANEETGAYYNTESIIPLNAQSFNFMSSKQPVKVQVTVTTASGLRNYDIYEFYLNDVPHTENLA
jgi:hypothetical protein